MAAMDDVQEDAMIITEKIEVIQIGLSGVKEKLIDMFKNVEHPQRQSILSQLDKTIHDWKDMVESQRQFMNKIEQSTLLNSIEVSGLPEHYTTDIQGVAIILSKLLHIRILESQITEFHRTGEVNFESNAPRSLVVTLIDQNIKKRILTVADSVVLRVTGSDMPMSITEHLTCQNRQLLKKARQEALKQNIENVWVEDGRIYVRRSDNSFIYEIKSEADIKRMAHY